MRLAFALCFCSLLPTIAAGQAGNDPEHVIRRMIDSGTYEGHDNKVLGSLGDAAAVLLTKILAGKEPGPNDIDMALIVLDASFPDPGAVPIAADREPRTALFVLRCFDSSTGDAALKKRIEETREYLRQRYAKYINSSPMDH